VTRATCNDGHAQRLAGVHEGLGHSGTPSSELGPPGAPSSRLGHPGTPSSELGPPGAPISGLGHPGTPNSGLGHPNTPSSGLRHSGTPSSGLRHPGTPSSGLIDLSCSAPRFQQHRGHHYQLSGAESARSDVRGAYREKCRSEMRPPREDMTDLRLMIAASPADTAATQVVSASAIFVASCHRIGSIKPHRIRRKDQSVVWRRKYALSCNTWSLWPQASLPFKRHLDRFIRLCSVKIKFSHTRYRALGLEVYRQSARR